MPAFRVTPLEECEHYWKMQNAQDTEAAQINATSAVVQILAILNHMRLDNSQESLADE